MIEASVQGIYSVESNEGSSKSALVVLKLTEQDRYMPIFTTVAQGENLASVFQGVQAERPRTYELMAELIERLGGRVESAQITAIQDRTIFATIRVVTSGGIEELNCRPSDALQLAMQTNVRIFIASEVMEQSGRDEVPISFPERVIKPWELEIAA